MDERSRSLSREEYLKELKLTSPENLDRLLVYYDQMRLYTGSVAAGFTMLAIASASVNYLSESEIADQVSFATGIITTALSMLGTIGTIKANYNGKMITSELQNRGFKVSRGFIRKIRN